MLCKTQKHLLNRAFPTQIFLPITPLYGPRYILFLSFLRTHVGLSSNLLETQFNENIARYAKTGELAIKTINWY